MTTWNNVVTFTRSEAWGEASGLAPSTYGLWRVHKNSQNKHKISFSKLRVGSSRSTWNYFRNRRVLLLIHGTGRNAKNTARELNSPWSGHGRLLTQLLTAYNGRVLAFNHPTLTHSIAHNAERLYASLPDRHHGWTVDILSVSRGGLVARQLSEGHADEGMGSRDIRFRKVAFVGTAQTGAESAKANNGPLILELRSLVHHPGDKRWSVIDAVRMDAVDAVLAELPGRKDMIPESDFLKVLNEERGGAPPAGLKYHAVASGYELPPAHPLRQAVLKVYGGTTSNPVLNDLVVRRRACLNPALDGDWLEGLFGDSFESVKVPDAHKVTHTAYLRSSAVREQLKAWLTGGP